MYPVILPMILDDSEILMKPFGSDPLGLKKQLLCRGRGNSTKIAEKN